MPPSIVITTRVLEYLAAVALGLIATTFLITRIFYVRRIARCKAGMRTLEREMQDLHGRIKSTEASVQPVPAPAGRGQQLVAIIAAIGGLSALVAATTPLVHDFLEGRYSQCNAALKDTRSVLTRLEGVVTFDANEWLAAEDVKVLVHQSTQKQTIVLSQNRIDNSGASIAVSYDGMSPAIIDSDKSVTIAMALQNPTAGVRLLVRPIRVQPAKK
jgi:hypothetical protein